MEQRKSDPVKTNCNVETLIARIEETGTDINERYKHWFRVGCALASEFGEEGRDYFHRLSRKIRISITAGNVMHNTRSV